MTALPPKTLTELVLEAREALKNVASKLQQADFEVGRATRALVDLDSRVRQVNRSLKGETK